MPADSPLKTLSDLKGKVIGVGALANANVPITRAMLKEIGLEPTRDYSFLAIGVGAQAFRATENKQVDTYNTFDTNIAAFENTGAALRRLPQEQKYEDLFSNGFAASDELIKNNPKMLVGFWPRADKRNHCLRDESGLLRPEFLPLLPHAEAGRRDGIWRCWRRAGISWLLAWESIWRFRLGSQGALANTPRVHGRTLSKLSTWVANCPRLTSTFRNFTQTNSWISSINLTSAQFRGMPNPASSVAEGRWPCFGQQVTSGFAMKAQRRETAKWLRWDRQ